VNSVGPIVREPLFRERLNTLRTTYANHDDVVQELAGFIRKAPDDQIVRINPIQYATDRGRDEAHIIDLFLHARKAGLLIMEWHYVCRGCGQIIASFDSLNAAIGHSFCKTCLKNRDTDLTDFVEIGFTVSKAVRKSRFHDPETLSPKEFYIDYNISANALARDGTKARDFYWRHKVLCTYVEPNETRMFEINLEPGFLVFQYGPELIIEPSSDNRVERIDIIHRDGRPAEPMQKVAPGSLIYKLTNASPARVIAFALGISEAELAAFKETPSGFSLGGFFSGSRLLSTQTFRDLFPSETVMSAGGLTVKRLALLFTDIKGSTALYDRIGDIKAFNLVRQHFGILRDVIATNHGALVKTIGDAVMASFHEPPNAIRAALDMLAQIRRFNENAGEELITLKIGAHVGPCLAVTLNGRLDYFGQTVNLAARVQGLAAENEICLSEEMYNLTDASDLLAGMQSNVQTVHVKGIAREINVRALRQESSRRVESMK
jgi:class 3 adenylate cyclase